MVLNLQFVTSNIDGSNSNDNWKGALVGLLLFVSGLVGTYFMSGSMIYGYIASINWVEVPAKFTMLD